MGAVYAQQSDLESALGVEEFTAAEAARALWLLDMASGVIEERTGQVLADGIDDYTLDGPGTDQLILPRWPVTSVLSVAEIDPATGTEIPLTHRTDYLWSQDGIITRIGGPVGARVSIRADCRWPHGPRLVHVMYRAGFTVFSRDLIRICTALAVRGWDNPKGVTEERLGDHSVKHQVPGMELTAAEANTLGQYRAKDR